MIRKMRIYKYECDDCGWVAYRGEIIPAGLCSKCGSTRPPLVSTEDKEYPILPEEQAQMDKAAEYVRRLQGGEDPSKLDQEIYGNGEDEMSWVSGGLRSISGCYISLGLKQLLQQPPVAVY